MVLAQARPSSPALPARHRRRGRGRAGRRRRARPGRARRTRQPRPGDIFLITRPSRPVPVTASRDSPASAMAFFAAGASSTSRAGAGAASGTGRTSTGPAKGTSSPGWRRSRGGGAGRHDGDRGELRIRRDRRAFGREDGREHAGGGRGHLDRDLVGLELAEHLVLRHGVAGLLEPGGNCRLGHAFPSVGTITSIILPSPRRAGPRRLSLSQPAPGP